jgi:uncharacterized membrane protein YphA (DoxX/SURF4 family)
MRKILSNDWLTLLCRLFFGGIFIYASLDKIAHPDQFARIVFNYHLVPGTLINLVALILPMSEFIAGVFVIVGVFYRGARAYLVILLSIFLIAIAINVFRGVNLECGCFTVSSHAKSAGLLLLLRDILYGIPGLILLFSRSRRWMLENLWIAPNR